MQSIDELAHTITDMAPADQEALLERVAQMNFQKGLADLAGKYRTRLASEKSLDISAELVLVELQRIREEVVSRDYPN